MNEKNNNILVSLIAIALLISIVFGAVALFKRIDETISDIDKGTTLTDKDNSSDKTDDTGNDTGNDTSNDTGDDTEGEEEPEEDADFYLNNQTHTGYMVVDNKTYFFREYKYVNDDYDVVTVRENSVKNFASYTHDINRYVINDYEDIVWEDISFGSFGYQSISLTSGYNHTVYISYTVIENCSNPSYVLEDLNQNVFFNPAYFNVEHTGAVG